MTNLIPPQGHKTLRREYIARVFSVYAFLLGGVFIALTALVVPTYVLVDTQLASVTLQNGAALNVDTTYKEAEAEIRRTNEILNQFSAEATPIYPSRILAEIHEIAHEGIAFERFQVKQAPKGSKEKDVITVQGVASSRTALAAFKDALNGSALFEDAVVPISDLARDADLPFAINLVLSSVPTTKP